MLLLLLLLRTVNKFAFLVPPTSLMLDQAATVPISSLPWLFLTTMRHAGLWFYLSMSEFQEEAKSQP